MRWAGLVARLVLGSVLIFSGASKRAEPVEEFAVVVESYGILPVDASESAAALLPWAELFVGFALIFGYFTQLSSGAAGVMLAGFLLALISTKARGIELPNCGCFGAGVHMPTWATMLLDSLLLIDAGVAFKFGAGALSLDNWADGRYTEAA